MGNTNHSPLMVFLTGLLNAVQVHKTLLFLLASRVTSIKTLQCFLLNGLIFIGSIAMFDNVLIPVVMLLGEHLQEYQRQHTQSTEIPNWETETAYIHRMVYLVFFLTWLAPMYLLTFVLNAIWYREIAEQVFKQEKGKVVVSASIATIVRDEIYRLLLMIWSSLFAFAVYFIPYVGDGLCLAYSSWIYAFYCFDYKWTLLGWSFQHRLSFFQEHWLYMLGFGLPCSAITLWFSQFIGYGLYAILFPVCMVLAIISAPVKPQQRRWLPQKIRMFIWGEWLNLALLRRMSTPKPKKIPRKTELDKKEQS